LINFGYRQIADPRFWGAIEAIWLRSIQTVWIAVALGVGMEASVVKPMAEVPKAADTK